MSFTYAGQARPITAGTTYAAPVSTSARPITAGTYAAPVSTSARPITTGTYAAPVSTSAPITSFASGYSAVSPTFASSRLSPVTTLPASTSVATRVVSQPATVVTSALQTAAVPFVQQKAETPWGGGCPWQSDKTAFKQFVASAIDVPSSKARKELYGFLAECFMDSDSDKDGHVTMDEFDFLIERAGALPRRFGMAPSWVEMYGDVAHRNEERRKMFTQMDTQNRGMIGLEEWVAFTINHIKEKRATMKMDTLDFGHLAGVGGDKFVDYCEVAVNNAHSEEYKSLYEHLFKVFVESDVEEAGVVHWQNFDVLVDDAAKAPRDAGLAPTTAEAYQTEAQKVAARKAEWYAMDAAGTGAITFEQFLAWALTHIAGKVQDYRAGNRYVKPATSVTYGAPVAVTTLPACPMTGAIGTCTYAPTRVLSSSIV